MSSTFGKYSVQNMLKYIIVVAVIFSGMHSTITGIYAQELSAVSADQEVVPDPELKAVLMEVLKKKQITTFKPEDLKSVFFLEAKNQKIKNLKGLEHCTNLASVVLADNQITDLTPISRLVGIQTLTLSGNKITDVTPLSGLTKLQYLDLQKNELSDIKPLSACTNLRTLYLSHNKIKDIAVLSNFPKLSSLHLEHNEINEIAALKELKWLSTINLKHNQVTDLAPLAELKELRYTFLQHNPLKSLNVLVTMAESDKTGKREFAPYWKLYLSKADIPADQLEKAKSALDSAGVKLTIEE